MSGKMLLQLICSIGSHQAQLCGVQRMFDNHTGFLPLSHVAHVDCKDGWLPPGIIAQVYSMLTRALCPPEGFTWATEGQFLVSRKRIQAQDWWVYKHLLVSPS